MEGATWVDAIAPGDILCRPNTRSKALSRALSQHAGRYPTFSCVCVGFLVSAATSAYERCQPHSLQCVSPYAARASPFTSGSPVTCRPRLRGSQEARTDVRRSTRPVTVAASAFRELWMLAWSDNRRTRGGCRRGEQQKTPDALIFDCHELSAGQWVPSSRRNDCVYRTCDHAQVRLIQRDAPCSHHSLQHVSRPLVP